MCGVSDLIAKWEKMEEYKITSWHAVVTVETFSANHSI